MGRVRGRAEEVEEVRNTVCQLRCLSAGIVSRDAAKVRRERRKVGERDGNGLFSLRRRAAPSPTRRHEREEASGGPNKRRSRKQKGEEAEMTVDEKTAFSRSRSKLFPLSYDSAELLQSPPLAIYPFEVDPATDVAGEPLRRSSRLGRKAEVRRAVGVKASAAAGRYWGNAKADSACLDTGERQERQENVRKKRTRPPRKRLLFLLHQLVNPLLPLLRILLVVLTLLHEVTHFEVDFVSQSAELGLGGGELKEKKTGGKRG
jgi:hypothetical protein